MAIIDCRPFLGALSLNAIFASARILIPVASDYLSLRGALQIEHTLKALGPVLKRHMEHRYPLTRFDRRRKMSFDVQERLRKQFGAELCEMVISENVAIAEAPAMSRDIFGHSPTSRGAQDYLALMGELRAARFVGRHVKKHRNPNQAEAWPNLSEQSGLRLPRNSPPVRERYRDGKYIQ